MTKVIFLDVDGVLNSYKNIIAYGGFPYPEGTVEQHDERHAEKNLDHLAVGMIRKLARDYDATIVLHSTWRAHTDSVDFGKRWNLPIVAGTNPKVGKPKSIQEYLNAHQDIDCFVVIDDDDMQVGKRQVWTDIFEGFSYANYVACQKKLAQPMGKGAGPEL